jgi:hypothetical protein
MLSWRAAEPSRLTLSEASGKGPVMAATTGDSRYIALTTYRRDGRPVTTPVWAVPLEGEVLRFHGQQHRQGEARTRHGAGALRALQHERPPHFRGVAGGHGTCRS